MSQLHITEIFFSLQGETRTVGLPTVFVRLAGCPLHCLCCDSAYAFLGGDWVEIDDILKEVASYGAHYVTLTGGEPLAQEACLSLLERLCNAGYEVSLETSGALDVSGVDNRVVKVVDIKTPGSGEMDRTLFANLDHLFPHDQIKFVIGGREDYDWAKIILEKYKLTERCQVLFSPGSDEQSTRKLADWIIEDRLKVRLQIE
ncbi:MAG: 7-carboxy-7-deazaguanine synthase QueE [Gammaproteobacteria bacterium]|nr:7-carboxy-7-deazaguanine synthase QueE [Gammaproteobacteria bacterium]